MKKVLLQTCLVLVLGVSSVAHAAYADLTAFTDDGSSHGVTLATNLAILTENTQPMDFSADRAQIVKNFQSVPIYSFEYIRSGVAGSATVAGSFGIVLLDAPIGIATTYSFSSPFSGLLKFEIVGRDFQGPVVGIGMLTLRNLSTSPALAPVPEPETYSMLLVGLGLMGTIARRRFKSRSGSRRTKSWPAAVVEQTELQRLS